MFKKGILLWQHKLICFFNLEKSVKSICGNLQTLYDISFLTEIWRFFGLLFQENYKDVITELWNVQKNWKNYVKICPLLLGSKKNFIILRIHFLQKINVGRENTSSQWLISFRKIQPCKLFLQAKGNVNNY